MEKIGFFSLLVYFVSLLSLPSGFAQDLELESVHFSQVEIGLLRAIAAREKRLQVNEGIFTWSPLLPLLTKRPLELVSPAVLVTISSADWENLRDALRDWKPVKFCLMQQDLKLYLMELFLENGRWKTHGSLFFEALEKFYGEKCK
ncbi:MAG: hypothetical protein KC643_22620 [Nitrospira sp.]|nr:hypothetical protein [Nitrospira sp.]